MTIMNKIRIMISVHLDGPDANVDNNDNSYTGLHKLWTVLIS